MAEFSSFWSELRILLYSDQHKRVLQETSNKDVILFVGNTKSGKSVTLNYTIGNPLKAVKKQDILQLKKTKTSLGPPIGGDAVSMTTVPSVWRGRGLDGLLVDTPGFGDNRGYVQDIANAFYLMEIVARVKSVKIVLVVDLNDITADNISPFTTAVDNIFVTWSACPDYPKCTTVVFTKCPLTLTRNNLKEILLEKIVKEPNISLKNRKLVEYICENTKQICKVPKPSVPGVLTNEFSKYIIESIATKCQQISREQLRNVKPCIADASKLFLKMNLQSIYEQTGIPEVLRQCAEEVEATLKKQQQQGKVEDFTVLMRNTALSDRDRVVVLQDRELSASGILKQLHAMFPEVTQLSEDSNIYINLDMLSFMESALDLSSEQIVSHDLKWFLETLKRLCSEAEERMLAAVDKKTGHKKKIKKEKKIDKTTSNQGWKKTGFFSKKPKTSVLLV